MLDFAFGAGGEVAKEIAPSLERDIDDVATAAQSQSIIAGIVISAALLIGIFVVAQIDDALPAIDNNDLSTAKNDTVTRIGDAMLIGAVVVIVLFAAIILRVLRSL